MNNAKRQYYVSRAGYTVYLGDSHWRWMGIFEQPSWDRGPYWSRVRLLAWYAIPIPTLRALLITGGLPDED